MEKLFKWHKNHYYSVLEKYNISSYQAAWSSWIKGVVFGIIIMFLCGCGAYQQVPVDKCCETDVVYLDEIKGDSVNVFTSLDFNTITLDFRPMRPKFHWGHNYGYWGSRPLWLDFDYYHGFNNYYSYYNPYYSYYRPWNVWDWYMKPWIPSNNWYQGPFNNQSYNVVYNSSRRSSLTESNRMSIENKIAFGKIGNSRLVTNKPVINTKPVIVNKPVVNNSKPVWNNNSNTIIRNNNKPNYNNSRPNYNNNNTNTKPSFNNNSRPSITVKSRGGKNN